MTIEFIIPTFNRNVELRSMLASLVAQTDREWTCHVIQDGDTSSVSEQILAEMNDKRFRLSYMDRTYNDWGHTLREYGKQQGEADYIVITNDDNYYVPIFIAELKKAAIDNPGMIFWDMVHSGYDYSYFICQPAYNQIDMGAFATRTDLAKQVRMITTDSTSEKYTASDNPHDILARNMNLENYIHLRAADGKFVDEFRTKFHTEKIVKINKVLFIHN